VTRQGPSHAARVDRNDHVFWYAIGAVPYIGFGEFALRPGRARQCGEAGGKHAAERDGPQTLVRQQQ
jgi:hypothetical protein